MSYAEHSPQDTTVFVPPGADRAKSQEEKMFYLIGYDDNEQKFVRSEFATQRGAAAAKTKHDYEHQQAYYLVKAGSEQEALRKADPRSNNC